MSQVSNGDIARTVTWPGVELGEVCVFLAVSEELHFGRAAERLQISRSRASQMIKGLEAKIGTRLFERTSRRVSLTPVGEQLAADLARPYRELREAFARARQSADGVAGKLRIGMYLPINGGRHMAEIIRAFKARHPGSDVELIDTGLERDDLDWLRDGSVDILATRLPATDPDLTVGPILSSEPRVLLVSKDDPLAARKTVCTDEFAERLVPDTPPFRREMIDAFIPPVTPSGRTLRRVPTRSPEDLLLRIAMGELVHPTVASLLAYLNHPEITCIEVSDLPPSETALVWLTANSSLAVEAFVRVAAGVLAGYRPTQAQDLAAPPAHLGAPI
jgi:DNA-binding transcriptional LysR family regulator